jgi:hypothetical protein
MFSYCYLSSILVLLVDCHSLKLMHQLLDLLVDVLDILAVSFVLPIFILFLVCLSVFVAELAFNLSAFLALLVCQGLAN